MAQRLLELCGETVDIDTEGRGVALADCMVELEKSYRFGPHSSIGLVSRAINDGKGVDALEILKDSRYRDSSWRSLPHPSRMKDALRQAVVSGYAPILRSNNPREALEALGGFRVLCALRKGPYGSLNIDRIIQEILKEARLIDGNSRWFRGRPILITENDYRLGLFNGDVGVTLPDERAGGSLRVFFLSPDGCTRRLLPLSLPKHETVFAMNVHKSQGSEFDEALLILPDRDAPVLTRELVYTGITRARERVQVWSPEQLFVGAVGRRITRLSGLRASLWERKNVSSITKG
jgi:exodeoxyribonuclease V alpha subunit